MGHVAQLSSARSFHNCSESWGYHLPVGLSVCNFENMKCWETSSEFTWSSNAALYSVFWCAYNSVPATFMWSYVCPYGWPGNEFPLFSYLKTSRPDNFCVCRCVNTGSISCARQAGPAHRSAHGNSWLSPNKQTAANYASIIFVYPDEVPWNTALIAEYILHLMNSGSAAARAGSVDFSSAARFANEALCLITANNIWA